MTGIDGDSSMNEYPKFTLLTRFEETNLTFHLCRENSDEEWDFTSTNLGNIYIRDFLILIIGKENELVNIPLNNDIGVSLRYKRLGKQSRFIFTTQDGRKFQVMVTQIFDLIADKFKPVINEKFWVNEMSNTPIVEKRIRKTEMV